MDKKHSAHQPQELKKHVALIHSHSRISLLQRKIANALLFHAYDNLLTQDEHVIQLSTLVKLIGYDSHDHKKIKQGLMDLLSTVIEWNIVDGDKVDKDKVWNASSLIADASINGATCTYSYSGKMRQLLYHPDVYGRLNMQILARFQSNYGLALYENCNRYQDIGQTPWFDLPKFRKLMGVEENKYKIFRDFKTRVLDKSVDEVNKHSQISVEPIYKRLDRQVIAIQFQIKKRKSTQEMNRLGSVRDILESKFSLAGKQLSELLARYDEPCIREKIQLLESSKAWQTGKIQNPGSWLLSALAEDYQPALKHSPQPGRFGNTVNETERSAYHNYLRERIFKRFAEMDTEPKVQIQSDFKKKIARTIFLKVYEQSGMSNLLLQDQFVKFILSFENTLSSGLETFEFWKKTQSLHALG